MTGKRAHDDEQGSEPKRMRSNQGSPVPARTNGVSDVERKKQEAMARIAAIKAKLAKPNGVSATPPPSAAATAAAPVAPPSSSLPTRASTPNGVGDDAKRAEAQRRIAEIQARMAGKSGATGAGAPPTAQQSDAQAKIAEARARAAALAASLQKDIPTTTTARAPPSPVAQDKPMGRGGLGVGLHPSLLGDTLPPSKDKPGQRGTNRREAPKTKVNPYLSVDQDGKAESASIRDPNLAAPRAGERKTRKFIFNEKGKYMAQANRLREQAELEEMKRRVAAASRKVEIEEAGDKVFVVPAPPNVEWWDEGLLPAGQDSYDEWDQPGRNRIDTADSIVTLLVQHPVMLAAPQDKFIPDAKPLMLTQTEQKKMRRQRRAADMKEEQAKIRLGLIPPPAPKVKKSNMMRVLGEQAVKDPTAVEVRVNREIAERAENHESANLERQLTSGQRHEKLKTQQAGDEAKGVRIAVFRVNNLSSGKHRYQIDVNAKQNAITGIVVLNPTMNLIVVEGGHHSINTYKKLMLNRIKWSENTAPQESTRSTTFTGTTDGSNADASAGTKGVGSKAALWCSPVDEHGELKDLSENQCILVWEGEEPTRTFKRWGSKACETDGEAREVLRRQKMENMWTLARGK